LEQVFIISRELLLICCFYGWLIYFEVRKQVVSETLCGVVSCDSGISHNHYN